jgi:uncharacterized membrane protein
MVAEILPLDFWNLFVVNVFGGFFPAVIGLMFVMFLVFMLGRVSMYSVLSFMALFVMCMAMGYGYGLVTLGITVAIMVRFAYDMLWVLGGKSKV